MERSRRWRRGAVAVALVLLLGAGSAWSDSRRRGSGVLREANPVTKTLRVEKVVFSVGPATEILDSEGVRLAPDQLWDRVGDPVRYIARSGSLRPILVRIILEDPEEEN